MEVGIGFTIGGNRREGAASSTSMSKRSLYFDESNGSPVSFTTPVDNKLFIDPKRIVGQDGACENGLFVTEAKINVSSLNRDTVMGYETAIVFNKLKQELRQSTNNSVYQLWTEQKFHDYLNQMVFALQTYYTIDSVLSYNPPHGTYNRVLENLRQNLSENADVMNRQHALRRLLQGFACPPNILEVVRWLCQFHLLGSHPNSMVARISFGMFAPANANDATCRILTSSYLNDSYDATLGLLDLTDILAPLLKIRPDWEITDLPLSQNHPTFDQNFVDLFCNMPTWQGSARFPGEAATETTFITCQIPEEMDGMLSAFYSWDSNYSGFITTVKCQSQAFNKYQLVPKGTNTEAHAMTDVPTTYIGRGDSVYFPKVGSTPRFVAHDGKVPIQVFNRKGTEVAVRQMLNWFYGYQ
jgi:hypothetical protein